MIAPWTARRLCHVSSPPSPRLQLSDPNSRGPYFQGPYTNLRPSLYLNYHIPSAGNGTRSGAGVRRRPGMSYQVMPLSMRCEWTGRRELAKCRRAALFVFFSCLSEVLRALPFLSAAQIAINFLERIPVQRKNIRDIILDEKDHSGHYSECHGLGFIDFCPEDLDDDGTFIFDDGRGHHYMLSEEDVTERVARWVVEALALVPAGMPLGSFTLVLNGNSAPEQCTQIFQRVQRDAAWQIALRESLDRGHLPKLAYHDRRRIVGYGFEDFPQALREISTGTCPAVRANFNVGEPWDVEAMIESHREWTLDDWEDKWSLSTRAWLQIA